MIKKHKILAVDDEPIDLKVITNALKDEYIVIPAQSGKEAINLLKREMPDLILLDVMMPEMSGYDVCKTLKANEKFAEIPIIFVTAFDTQDGELRGLELGGIDYISKPINFALLKMRVKNHISMISANKALDSFARTVAHDLRAPLTPIIGYADILRSKYSGQLDERAIRYLDEIIETGTEMLQMLKDLLALATVGKVAKPATEIDANDVVTGLVKSYSEKLARAKMAVSIASLPSLRVPKTLLTQIFENLILNAIKYGSTPGGVIGIGGERDGDLVKFYVCDHGPGIPPDERDKIFQIFARGSTTGEEQGTGVGLATVQRIVGLFDGEAWVEETPGGGSTFWVSFMDRPDV